MSALIGYGRPDDASWNCVGTGASFDGDASALNNGRVADVTPVIWSSDAQTTATSILLQQSWPAPQQIRIIPLLNLCYWNGSERVPMPSGVRLSITGKRSGDPDFAYDLGGNSTTQRTVTLADGSTAAWIITDAASDPLVGMQVEWFNDQNGATFLAASQQIYPGEIDSMAGWSPPNGIDATWDGDYDGLPTEYRSRLGNQPWILPSRPFRLRNFNLGFVDFDSTWAVDPVNLCFDQVSSILVLGDACALIPRTVDAAGNLDVDIIHQLALFGIPRGIKKPRHLGGDLFAMSITAAESAPDN